MMLHWDEKGRYQLPGDRDAIDWANVAVWLLAAALWIIALLGVPGPH